MNIDQIFFENIFKIASCSAKVPQNRSNYFKIDQKLLKVSPKMAFVGEMVQSLFKHCSNTSPAVPTPGCSNTPSLCSNTYLP